MPKTVCTIKMIRLFGDSLMLGIFLLMVWLFVCAYSNNHYSAIININKYGEAQIEMILLLFILLPLFLFTTAFSFFDWKKTVKPSMYIIEQNDQILDYTRSYYLGEDIICPRCNCIFFVSESYFTDVICPFCGLSGAYYPSEEYQNSADFAQ
ncbi:MAG: hypothetical protein JSW00_08180 [Thermoplasmata archaeon]|nr:MAG: hypothetical protein JSW00_08180 [Thermoplasmata archaeon]